MSCVAAELSAPQQLAMKAARMSATYDSFSSNESEPVVRSWATMEVLPKCNSLVAESGKDVATPRSQDCSTCDSSVDARVGSKGVPQSSSGSTSPRSQSCVGHAEPSVGQLSPRSQLRVGQAQEIKTFVSGAYTGDGFDPRWLAETLVEERLAASFSGDGTLDNVGRNTTGEHQCKECSQQFGSDAALNCHMKFTHQQEEPEFEWLSFPSA